MEPGAETAARGRDLTDSVLPIVMSRLGASSEVARHYLATNARTFEIEPEEYAWLILAAANLGLTEPLAQPL